MLRAPRPPRQPGVGAFGLSISEAFIPLATRQRACSVQGSRGGTRGRSKSCHHTSASGVPRPGGETEAPRPVVRGRGETAGAGFRTPGSATPPSVPPAPSSRHASGPGRGVSGDAAPGVRGTRDVRRGEPPGWVGGPEPAGSGGRGVPLYPAGRCEGAGPGREAGPRRGAGPRRACSRSSWRSGSRSCPRGELTGVKTG